MTLKELLLELKMYSEQGCDEMKIIVGTECCCSNAEVVEKNDDTIYMGVK